MLSISFQSSNFFGSIPNASKAGVGCGVSPCFKGKTSGLYTSNSSWMLARSLANDVFLMKQKINPKGA